MAYTIIKQNNGLFAVVENKQRKYYYLRDADYREAKNWILKKGMLAK